ncbi:MAG: FtsX-like permease family protein [Pseudomonadota bacterium]
MTGLAVLDRKVLRDLGRLWVQALAIALVLSCGVASLIISFGAYRSLEETRAAYYDRNRFGDVFANVTRAPRALLPRIEAIDGVGHVELRVSDYAILDILGMREPATGLAVSIPDYRETAVNLPFLRSGRLPEPERTNEVTVTEKFAEAHGFRTGDSFQAILNGTKRDLIIVGTFLSPEFIYALAPGDIMPDPRRFAIMLFSERALSGLLDLEGAFNDLSIRLLKGANKEQVIDRLDAMLAPFGGTGAIARKDQMSHAFIDAELAQLQSMSTLLPPIFLLVSAFLINMILSRLIALEREQIGLFKAVGYSSGAIAMHYLKLVMVISMIGIIIGFGVGTWLGRGLFRLFGEFYTFPFLIFRLHIDIYLIAALISLAAAVAGGLKAVWSTVTLPPAVAMSAPAPTTYRKLLTERLGLLQPFSRLTVMGLRHLVRHPVRSGLTTLGMSCAVGLLSASMYFLDVNTFMIDWLYNQSQRQNASVTFIDEQRPDAVQAIKRLPGVIKAEPTRHLAVTMSHGYRERRTSLVAKSNEDTLARVVDQAGNIVWVPRHGVLINDQLARNLDVQVGDLIHLEITEGKRRIADVPVTHIVTSFFGIDAYMDAEALDRLAGEGPRVDGFHLTMDEDAADDLYREVKELPRIASLVLLDLSREKFQETLSQNSTIMATIYIVLSVIIAFGVMYNAARIQLSERARELASLRVLGFTSREVFSVLLAELSMIVILAQPLGWFIGFLIAWSMVQSFDSDLFRIPLIVEIDTMAIATIISVIAVVASLYLIWERVQRLDLIRVLKTRD